MAPTKQPTRQIASNLRFTRSGVVWADYLLEGLEYGYRPTKDKSTVRDLHRMLARSLHGESLLLGVCAGLDPLAIVERMERGVDLDLHPVWDAECDATVDSLEQIRPGRRIYWLSVPLGTHKAVDQIKIAAHSGFADIVDFLGMPAAAVSAKEVAARQKQADKIAALIPADFHPTPVTPAQMVWLWTHQLSRGLGMDPDLPEIDPGAHEGDKTAASFRSARFDPGSRLDREEEGIRAHLPSYDKVLRIDQPWELEDLSPSYQVTMCLADLPAGGSLFPGSEFLSICDDQAGRDIDWAMRLQVRSTDEVRAKNRRALINLNEQFHQRDGEQSHAMSHLQGISEDLAEYDSLLENDRMEVEVEFTTMITAAGPTAEEAVSTAKEVAKAFELANYRIIAPTGFQEDLFWACVPGHPKPTICSEFRQITTSGKWAMYVPCVRHDLGDATGPLLALNISTARIGVVHHDIAGKAVRDVSGSLAVVGDLGSGKSVTLKTAGNHIIDRGGQLVVVDSTVLGEYERWAGAIAESTVVNVGEPTVSLDPLRMFSPRRGAEVVESLLMPLLDLEPASRLGAVLSDVLDPAYRSKHDIGSLANVVTHLNEGGCSLNGADEVAERMRVFARSSYTKVLFDDSLPVLRPTSPAIVFRTHTLSLPSHDEVQHQHLYRQLSIQKRVGRALYQLIAELAKTICFADPDRLAGFLCDEVHRITDWPEGVATLKQFNLDGRKHDAALILGSQAPEGLGDPTMQSLIPTRIVMRQTDADLARRCLEWLGMDLRDDDSIVKELREQTSPSTGRDNFVEEHRRGEGYMRDASGNIGRIKVMAPATASRRKAVTTTPKRPEGPSGGAASELVTG